MNVNFAELPGAPGTRNSSATPPRPGASLRPMKLRILVISLFLALGARAGDAPVNPPPTLVNVPYGPHERQVLDFWQAESPRPTPVVFFMHGGSWLNGDKTMHLTHVREYLAAGISVVSINYRYVGQAYAAGVQPPVAWPLHDAARALQFVRSKAPEWKLDKARIGGSGGSAGACSSLWLAFHPDLADPQSSDPVARESTRLWCVAPIDAQTSLDPQQLHEWLPNLRYGGHAFGFFKKVDGRDRQDFDAFFAHREKVLPWIQEYSPYGLVTSDDPPVYLYYNEPPLQESDTRQSVHSPVFGLKLQEKLRSAGVPCTVVYPGAPDPKYPAVPDWLIAKLHAAAPAE